MFSYFFRIVIIFLAFLSLFIVYLTSLNYSGKSFVHYSTLGKWSDYSLQQSCHPRGWHQPASIAQLSELVSSLSRANQSLKVVAAGHAMSSIAMVDNGHLVNLDKLNRIISIDTVSKTVSVEAGIRIHELTDLLEQAGLSLKNVGQIQEQSIAGAISTGTHGSTSFIPGTKILNHQSLSSSILELDVMDAFGVVHTVNESQPALFDACRVGLGAMGIITRVKIQCVDAFNLEKHEFGMQLDELLVKIDYFLSNSEYFRWWWIPGTNATKVMIFNRSKQPRSVTTWRGYIDNWISRKLEIPILVSLLSLGKYLGYRRVVRFMSPIFQLEKKVVARSDISLSGPVTEKYTEMEYFIPIENFHVCHKEIREYVNTHKLEHNFVQENRFIAKDDIMLSPYHGRDTASISLVLYDQDLIFEGFARGMETIFIKHGGRPHWGKAHYRFDDVLKTDYPRLKEFLKLREKMDPKGIFLNNYLKTVFEVENDPADAKNRIDIEKSVEDAKSARESKRLHDEVVKKTKQYEHLEKERLEKMVQEVKANAARILQENAAAKEKSDRLAKELKEKADKEQQARNSKNSETKTTKPDLKHDQQVELTPHGDQIRQQQGTKDNQPNPSKK